MKVSVIIPVYNEEEVIVDCLESLVKQSLKDFEVIVVDDGSSDKSKVKIQKSKDNLKFKNIEILDQDHKGAGAARNKGAKKAKGEILVFVDADMTFEKDFLKKLIDPIEKGEAKGTFSKDEYVENWDNVWARCWNINEGWENKRRHPANYPDTQPVFRAILKSEFERIGGFEPGGYDDDWSLSRRFGYEAVNATGAKFYHKNPSSLTEVFSHAMWVAKRPYKLGFVGKVIALIRASFPISVILGIVKSIQSNEPKFLIFKIIYDFGIFVGLLELILLRKNAK